MPFDLMPNERPQLRHLAFVLRNKHLWPELFQWDFRYPRSCAMGLAHKLWPDMVRYASPTEMARVFDLSYQTVHQLFVWPGLLWQVPTPELIADLIEAVSSPAADLIDRKLAVSSPAADQTCVGMNWLV